MEEEEGRYRRDGGQETKESQVIGDGGKERLETWGVVGERPGRDGKDKQG